LRILVDFNLTLQSRGASRGFSGDGDSYGAKRADEAPAEFRASGFPQVVHKKRICDSQYMVRIAGVIQTRQNASFGMSSNRNPIQLFQLSKAVLKAEGAETIASTSAAWRVRG
jgi:hypothetical protein